MNYLTQWFIKPRGFVKANQEGQIHKLWAIMGQIYKFHDTGNFGELFSRAVNIFL